jgi:NAD-dependent SIR2 family protein deacetylase
MILPMPLSCLSKYLYELVFINSYIFRSSKNILIISGAGVSTSCGIPDFRSAKGIYASLKQTFPDLPHPTAMFDIDYFKKRPQPFYSFAKVTLFIYANHLRENYSICTCLGNIPWSI